MDNSYDSTICNIQGCYLMVHSRNSIMSSFLIAPFEKRALCVYDDTFIGIGEGHDSRVTDGTTMQIDRLRLSVIDVLLSICRHICLLIVGRLL
jgi:hypothetical protein